MPAVDEGDAASGVNPRRLRRPDVVSVCDGWTVPASPGLSGRRLATPEGGAEGGEEVEPPSDSMAQLALEDVGCDGPSSDSDQEQTEAPRGESAADRRRKRAREHAHIRQRKRKLLKKKEGSTETPPPPVFNVLRSVVVPVPRDEAQAAPAVPASFAALDVRVKDAASGARTPPARAPSGPSPAAPARRAIARPASTLGHLEVSPGSSHRPSLFLGNRKGRGGAQRGPRPAEIEGRRAAAAYEATHPGHAAATAARWARATDPPAANPSPSPAIPALPAPVVREAVRGAVRGAARGAARGAPRMSSRLICSPPDPSMPPLVPIEDAGAAAPPPLPPLPAPQATPPPPPLPPPAPLTPDAVIRLIAAEQEIQRESSRRMDRLLDLQQQQHRQ